MECYSREGKLMMQERRGSIGNKNEHLEDMPRKGETAHPEEGLWSVEFQCLEFWTVKVQNQGAGQFGS